MKLVIDIDENVYTRLFDNGEDIAKVDISEIAKAIRKGKTFKTGHWINMLDLKSSIYQPFYKCSECGYFDFVDANFCPLCGSRMIKEGEVDNDTN